MATTVAADGRVVCVCDYYEVGIRIRVHIANGTRRGSETPVANVRLPGPVWRRIKRTDSSVVEEDHAFVRLPCVVPECADEKVVGTVSVDVSHPTYARAEGALPLRPCDNPVREEVGALIAPVMNLSLPSEVVVARSTQDD